MILADTNVIIDFWHKPTERARRTFEELEIATCGIVRAELLHGARSEDDVGRIYVALDDLVPLEITEPLWRQLGRNLKEIRERGLSVPFQDAALASLCVAHDVQLWTHDQHFVSVQQILTNLRFFLPADE